MGVHGLWTIVQPCARPIKLETLAQKRLAVDASIWIYQFLKAVRDKEGNALRNSHIVGFFRRIVKLLFHGIRPVFVFDGGAPLLKKQTITNRKSRREGRKEDAIRTAGKLLSLQMQRRAQDDKDRRKRLAESREDEAPVEIIPEQVVYVDELEQTGEERQKNRQFRKKDQYHLPELDSSIGSMGAPNDPRIMSTAELEDYARQFEGGEDINLYDFSKIDFDSIFFTSLPAADRYNILNAARLRSRLRMGLSKEQLDTMFPNRLDFSKFQIDRVKERNELTQRLMNLNGMNDDLIGVNRVAGERNREYMLVKNDGVEGGWALGVVGKKGEREGEGRKTAIVIDDTEKQDFSEEDEWEDDMDDFEDVPIEGLNRVPKVLRKQRVDDGPNEYREARRLRRAMVESKAEARKRRILADSESAPVFIQDDELGDDEDLLDDDQPANDKTDFGHNEDDDELQKAIALSLGKDQDEGADEEDALQRAINMSLEQNNAHNLTENKSTPIPAPLSFNKEVQEEETYGGFYMDNDDNNDGDFDLSAAIEATRPSPIPVSALKPLNPAKKASEGLLPFESLNFSGGLASLKKRKEEEKTLGSAAQTKKSSTPLPPWFSAQETPAYSPGASVFLNKDKERAPRELSSNEQNGGDSDQEDVHHVPITQRGTILNHEEGDIVDLVSDHGDEKIDSDVEMTEPSTNAIISMGDIAEKNKIQPAVGNIPNQMTIEADTVVIPSSPVMELEQSSPASNILKRERPAPRQVPAKPTQPEPAVAVEDDDFESSPVHWSDSDHEQASFERNGTSQPTVNHPGDDSYDNIGDTSLEYMEDEDAAAQYSNSEDEEMIRQLDIEANEHARFASTLNDKSAEQNAADYERELRQLRNQQKKDRRDADEVTHIMVTECQQLLQMFGIPYITAPMEAEAQCAELVHLGLVDGIVTDDSDIFLFGGTRVYKNMFNQAKFVECYLTNDLESEYSLDRRKLIRLAHLLGSDYTEGLPGVGPVTALELLAEFSGEDGLREFKEWWNLVQSGLGRPTDEKSTFRKKFRKLSEKLFLSPTFPDDRVNAAYLEPEVDKDPSPFEWGVPDLDGLRSYLMATIGWTPDRTDEVLVPVIRDMNRKLAEGTQTNITNFFSGGAGAGAFAPRVRDQSKSKRMETALMSLHRKALASKDQQQPISLKRHGSSILPDSASEDDELVAITPLNGNTAPPARKRGKATGKGKGTKLQAKKAKAKAKAKENTRDSDEFDDSDMSDKADINGFNEEVEAEDDMDDEVRNVQSTKTRTKMASRKTRGTTKRRRKADD